MAQYGRAAAARLGYDVRTVDADEGYLLCVSAAGRRAYLGTGALTPFVQNSAGAAALCRDKAYTAQVLQDAGLASVPTRLFFLDPTYSAYRAPGREASDALSYAAAAGAPLFWKPNGGSRGRYAEALEAAAVPAYLERLRRHHDTVVAQPIISGTEHRIFVQHGSALFAYRKTAEPGRAANLSLGGGIDGFTDAPPTGLAALAIRAAAVLGCRICGLDIFDRSPAGDLSDLVVLEANANPGIAALEQVGRTDLMDLIWRDVFETALANAV
jgi:glutathione synthase/RimK-type ligase-like ATP-grasp enzyme